MEKVFLVNMIGAAAISLAGPAGADNKINCSNEFRSGKLYFSQEIYDKAVDRFALAVEVCPEKAEYRARYAMALAQFGGEKMSLLPLVPPENRDAAVDSVASMFRLAGAEFDSSLAYDDSKKNKKFVRENRQHFWVDHYNRGIKLYDEKNYEAAELEFRLSRFMAPTNVKGYSQGAIALISLGQKSEAAKLVQEGLEIEAEDEKLNQLLESIYIDAANDLVKASEEEKDAAKADEAIGYLDEVLTRREGKDTNLLFRRGVAYMAKGAAEVAEKSGDGEVDAGAESYRSAAENFRTAAELVPPEGEDKDFHLAALYNRLQSQMNSGDFDASVETMKAYLAIDPKDASIWQSWAMCLSQKDDSDGAVAALMVSKSLAATGSEIPLADALANAKEDEKTALEELGEPTFIHTYQETGSGNQINTWFWPEKRTARSFILGVKNGEMTW